MVQRNQNQTPAVDATENIVVTTTLGAPTTAGADSNNTLLNAGAETTPPVTGRSVKEIRQATFSPEIFLGCEKANEVIHQTLTRGNWDEVKMFRRGQINTLSAEVAFKIKEAETKGYEVFVAAMELKNPGAGTMRRRAFSGEFSLYLKIDENYVG
ncbi:uncharacterized protein LOC62_02G003372 [Vanrija pseudolonga]|uniref:Uncharacterized protein n=1 Tax=Vanrija pseudolonga TaxID=143232 RepID=A0AAF1BH79_9TREE|nr:hypothetical protein LOC62_02G003372 [Vanrija pseudolonga]